MEHPDLSGPPARVIAPSRPDRLPPGQVVTRKWPVLHYSHVPVIDPARWRFEVSGLVDRPLSLRWEGLERVLRSRGESWRGSGRCCTTATYPSSIPPGGGSR